MIYRGCDALTTHICVFFHYFLRRGYSKHSGGYTFSLPKLPKYLTEFNLNSFCQTDPKRGHSPTPQMPFLPLPNSPLLCSFFNFFLRRIKIISQLFSGAYYHHMACILLNRLRNSHVICQCF
jgi:hypothetical protein